MPEPSFQAASYDLLPEVIEETFSFQFPFITQPQDQQKEMRLFGPAPFMFYDRHVNEGQRLKYVASLPSLTDDITRIVDDRLEELKKTGSRPLPLWHETIIDFAFIFKGARRHINEGDREFTTDVLGYRIRSLLSEACLPLISNWVIHPRAPKYYSTLWFDDDGSRLPPAGVSTPCEDFKIRFVPLDRVHRDVLDLIPDAIKDVMADWHDRDLATWIFLPLSPDSEQLLRNLDSLWSRAPKRRILASPCCATQGFPVSFDHAPRPGDAKVTPWTLPVVHPSAMPCSVKSDLRERSAADDTVHPRSSCHPSSKFLDMKDPTPEGLVHHVWRVAVQKDTTVIVIHCGNHERIGIRHRASQTLYLSDVIDLTEPGYGKLHLGTLMSAVCDTLSRYQAFREKNPVPRTKKRPRSPEKNEVRRSSKRQRLNHLLERSRVHSLLGQRDSKILWTEIAQRPLLLLRFSGGGLNSSVPASCLRMGSCLSRQVQAPVDHSCNTTGESYQSSEYFLLTLDWEIASGRTAQVFPGYLQLTLPGGRKLLQTVVAKIAYYKEAQERVRQEYQVYQRLWAHKVKRIPEIYGLFEDVDNLATILVMERAAYTFRQREPATKENKGLLQEVQPSERSACMTIVKAIHDAGVVHRDLRAENLVIAQDGKPMVIDFDHAALDAPERWKDMEMKSIEDLLSGKLFFRF
ncbi:hypothetical protein BDN72DRAFT_963688 [Pluteus cervinus]|uniref:Uncharacterized protein n=1 Tax=Pluteus cervinus TaxID=181527 RepID=A0ACD3ADY8_9AGAR|nr:hypothetical protein BDN72DRAFT_963688 [Pluteus cervinus]